jgi:2-desacetyl-2-hydroxyethyl bacteriochlorophyllide A dehydrogenase
MLAARLHEGVDRLAIEEIDRPAVGPTDVLVDLRAASVCGSDVHHLFGDLPIDEDQRPVTLGHEGAGVVAEVGSEVEHLASGDHVVVNYVVSCGKCEPCLEGYDNRCRNRESVGSDVDGTFAQFITIPARSAIRMPESVPFGWGSIAGCAVSTAYHAIRRADIEPDDDVVVFGAGGVGLHAVLFATRSLARSVTAVDLVDRRLAAAEEYGADVIVNPREEDVAAVIDDLTDGWGVDIALECSGATVAMEQAIDAINGENRFASGTTVSVGLQEEPFEANYWELREGQLLVSGDHTRAELWEVMSLLAAGEVDLDPSIATTVDLADIDEGIQRAGEDDSLTGRIVVDTS